MWLVCLQLDAKGDIVIAALEMHTLVVRHD